MKITFIHGDIDLKDARKRVNDAIGFFKDDEYEGTFSYVLSPPNPIEGYVRFISGIGIQVRFYFSPKATIPYFIEIVALVVGGAIGYDVSKQSWAMAKANKIVLDGTLERVIKEHKL